MSVQRVAATATSTTCGTPACRRTSSRSASTWPPPTDGNDVDQGAGARARPRRSRLVRLASAHQAQRHLRRRRTSLPRSACGTRPRTRPRAASATRPPWTAAPGPRSARCCRRASPAWPTATGSCSPACSSTTASTSCGTPPTTPTTAASPTRPPRTVSSGQRGGVVFDVGTGNYSEGAFAPAVVRTASGFHMLFTGNKIVSGTDIQSKLINADSSDGLTWARREHRLQARLGGDRLRRLQPLPADDPQRPGRRRAPVQDVVRGQQPRRQRQLPRPRRPRLPEERGLGLAVGAAGPGRAGPLLRSSLSLGTQGTAFDTMKVADLRPVAKPAAAGTGLYGFYTRHQRRRLRLPHRRQAVGRRRPHVDRRQRPRDAHRRGAGGHLRRRWRSLSRAGPQGRRHRLVGVPHLADRGRGADDRPAHRLGRPWHRASGGDDSGADLRWRLRRRRPVGPERGPERLAPSCCSTPARTPSGGWSIGSAATTTSTPTTFSAAHQILAPDAGHLRRRRPASSGGPHRARTAAGASSTRPSVPTA